MKLTLAAFLLLSSSVFAETVPVETGKVMDGKEILCILPSDAGRLGYRPEVIRVSRTGENVRLSFILNGLKCVFKAGEGMKMIPQYLNSGYRGKSLDGQTVHYDIIRSDAMLIGKNFNLIDRVELRDLEVQNVEFLFSLNDILSSEQRRRFDRGLPVVLNLEYYNLVSTRYTYNGRTANAGASPWGSYYIEITLQK